MAGVSAAPEFPSGRDAVLECLESRLALSLHLFHAASASRAGLLAGFLVALLRVLHGTAKVLWVSQRSGNIDGGAIYGPGLLEAGLSPARFLFVEASRSSDVLWAVEEGLRSKAVGVVVGEFGRDAHALDLQATRRLSLRSNAAAIPVYLAVNADEVGATAARTRWRIASAPSRPARGPQLLGDPIWSLELLKNRSGPCGHVRVGYSPVRAAFVPLPLRKPGASDRILFDRKPPSVDPSSPVVIPFTAAIRQDEGDGR